MPQVGEKFHYVSSMGETAYQITELPNINNSWRLYAKDLQFPHCFPRWWKPSTARGCKDWERLEEVERQTGFIFERNPYAKPIKKKNKEQ